MISWDSFTGIVGMRTKATIKGKAVCVGDGVEFKDTKGKVHQGTVGVFQTRVVIMYDTFFGDGFKSLNDVEILDIIQEHTKLKVGHFNFIAGHRVEVFELEGLEEFKY